ncbi:MAG: LacI family DNA-binding transcriptional regulator [Planctomycetes bacterium]|nr:LacI family DNA-binding transcriptional regulator [Planctomycetota bacterium]
MAPGSSKWQRVYQTLRSQFLTMPPGAPVGRTIADIARDLGVNHKTVARAVRLLRSEGILLAGRGRRLRISSQRPAPFEAGSCVLYVASHGAWDSPFMVDLTAAVRKAANAMPLNLRTVFVRDFDDVIPLVKSGGVLGAIVSFVVGTERETEAVRFLRRFNIPVCTVDYSLPGIDSVEFDNVALGRRMGRRLFTQQSFRRVLICSRRTFAPPEFDRDLGIRQIMDELAVPHERVTWFPAFSGDDIKPLAGFIESGIRFDAVFVHYIGLKPLLEELFSRLGVPLPPIMSIGVRATLRNYRMSGVAVPSAQLGSRAMQLLLDRCRDPQAPPRKVLCDSSSLYEYKP